MAPRAAPRSCCPDRPALPRLSPAPKGTGSDWKNLPGTAHTDRHNILALVGKAKKQGRVSHCGLANYIKKYLKAKEELWKLRYFTMQKIPNLQKKIL